MLSWSVEAVLFQAIVLIYFWVVILCTENETKQLRLIGIGVIFLVIPGMVYLYYRNYQIIDMLMSENTDSRQEIKKSSFGLKIIWWILAIGQFISFISLTILIILIVIVIIHELCGTAAEARRQNT